MEDVKAGTKGAAWYQLYLVGGREVAEGAIERAVRLARGRDGVPGLADA